MYNTSYIDWLRAQKFSKEQNERVQKEFLKTVAKIDALEMETALRRLIADKWGTRTFMIDEPAALDAGRS